MGSGQEKRRETRITTLSMGLLPLEQGILAENPIDHEALSVGLEILPLDFYLRGDDVRGSHCELSVCARPMELTEVGHCEVHHHYVDQLIGLDVRHGRLDKVPGKSASLRQVI